MAGILDNKERFIDTLVTNEGRRQAAYGQLRIHFATFTDMHTFYQASGSHGVAEDATDRIFFEATSRYQDVIIPELEPGENGISIPFKAGDFIIRGKTIASGTFRRGDSPSNVNILSGSELQRAIPRFLDGVTENFTDLRIIRTSDHFDPSSEFSLSLPHTASFIFGPNTEYNEAPNSTGVISLDTSLSLFQDRRMSHLPNFRYLPPVNVSGDQSGPGELLGIYPRLEDDPILEWHQLSDQLANRDYVDIAFSKTSRDNNLICQFFEFSSDEVQKLSIIDFGQFSAATRDEKNRRVYFVGKILKDSNGSDTFMNMFTMVFT